MPLCFNTPTPVFLGGVQLLLIAELLQSFLEPSGSSVGSSPASPHTAAWPSCGWCHSGKLLFALVKITEYWGGFWCFCVKIGVRDVQESHLLIKLEEVLEKLSPAAKFQIRKQLVNKEPILGFEDNQALKDILGLVMKSFRFMV